ncbi:MAG: transporter substrate-binding domain-containing protein [Pseudomonadota bacterium]
MKIVAGLFSALLAFNSHAEGPCTNSIKWLAADLPPFIWEQRDGPHGFGHELIAAMSGHMGCQPDIRFYPWARAVKTAAEGKKYGVLPLARTPEREASFKWLIRLVSVKYAFFGRSGPIAGMEAVDLNNIEQLRTQRIGVLRGSPIPKNLRDKNFTNIVYEKSYQDLLKMVLLGAIDAIYAGDPMLSAAIELSGLDPKDFRSGISLGSADLYLGASPDLDAAEEARWLRAYETIQKDGTVTRLQKKYFNRRLP